MRKKIATVPVLKTPKKGKWYVYLQVRNPFTGRMEVKKFTKGFSKCKNTKERLKWGNDLCDELITKLKEGWTPYEDYDQAIYEDQVDYQLITNRFRRAKSTVKNTRYYISEFLLDKRPKVVAKTYSCYRSKLRIFNEYLDFKKYNEFNITEISNKIVKEFFMFLIDERKLDRVTIDKYNQIIHSFFEYLKEEKRIFINPVFNITKPPKTKDCAARPISDYDLKELLIIMEEDDPQLYLACMFQYYLALRPGQELRLIKVQDIDIFNYRVVVTEENAKTSRRTIDMPKELAELCQRYNIHHFNGEYYVFGRNKMPGREPLGQNTLRNRFNTFRDRLGLPKVYKFYSMKHTGGGKLLESGRTLEELRNHFGHTSIESTDHYVRRHFGNRNKNIIYNFPKPFE